MSGTDPQAYTMRAVSAATSLTANDYVVTATATSAYTITLPDSESTVPGRPYTIIKDNAAANAITIAGFDGGDTINGAATLVLASGAYHGAILVNDGNNWWAQALY